jgi:hypothetical protein
MHFRRHGWNQRFGIEFPSSRNINDAVIFRALSVTDEWPREIATKVKRRRLPPRLFLGETACHRRT